VGDRDTAEQMGSGSVPVLATPRLIALCEEASCRALDGIFDDSKTSVGVRVQFDHLAPLKPGSVVTAEAVLERVEGKRLTFTIAANDAAGLVGAGRLKASDARVARLALALMAKTGPDGRPEIAASLTIQNGEMFLGPAKLGPAPRIDW